MATVNITGFSRSTSRKSAGLLSATMSLYGNAKSFSDAKNQEAMGLLNEDFLAPMQGLLPRGVLWNRDSGTELTNLMRALSYRFTNIVRRGLELLEEADPRTTLELLPDWERLLGLPDCDGVSTALADRRNAVLSKLRGYKAPTETNLKALAADVGYNVDIVTFEPFTAGSFAGHYLTNGDWRFAWEVDAPHGPDDTLLECVLAKVTPLHTLCLVHYIYSTWVHRDPDASYSDPFYSVAHDQVDTWCAVGGTGGAPKVQTSDDHGYTWTEQSPTAFSGDFTAVAHNGSNLWCAVGLEVFTPVAIIQTSADGASWTSRSPDGAPTDGFNAIAHDQSSLWCAVGDTLIQTSPDGTTWTDRTIPESTNYYGVAYGNSLWVTVGAGVVATSSDGASWTTQTTTPDLRAVAFNGTDQWCGVGDSGEIWTADEDATTWTQQTSGVATQLLGVTWSDNSWHVVGASGVILGSGDGENWVADTPDASYSGTFQAVAFDGLSQICAVGASGEIQTAGKSVHA